MKNRPTRLLAFLALGIVFSLFAGLVLLGFSRDLDRLLEPTPQDFPPSAAPDPLLLALDAFRHPRFVRTLGIGEGSPPDIHASLADQLVPRDRKRSRGLRRWAYSVLLELRYPERTVVTFFFNRASMGRANGRPIQGFVQAARTYFGVEAEELTLGESLLLCDLALRPQTPPNLGDPRAALETRNRLLNVMRQSGLLTDSTYEAEVARPYASFPDHRPVE